MGILWGEWKEWEWRLLLRSWPSHRIHWHNQCRGPRWKLWEFVGLGHIWPPLTFISILSSPMSSFIFHSSAYDNNDPEATRFFVTEDSENGALVRCVQSIDEYNQGAFIFKVLSYSRVLPSGRQSHCPYRCATPQILLLIPLLTYMISWHQLVVSTNTW